MNKENKKEAVTYLLIILFIILVRTYVVTPVRVSGSSMANTLKNGEILLLNKFEYRFSDIKRFDIVVVKAHKERIIKSNHILISHFH